MRKHSRIILFRYHPQQRARTSLVQSSEKQLNEGKYQNINAIMRWKIDPEYTNQRERQKSLALNMPTNTWKKFKIPIATPSFT